MAVKKNEERKEQILRAAEKLFARKGYPETTIVDIVKEAKISEATLYEYFSSKEELLFSIPRGLTLMEKEKLEFILAHVRGVKAKIRCFIYHYLWIWQTHPDYTSIALLQLRQNRNFSKTEEWHIIRDFLRTLIPDIKNGIENGELKPETNPELVLTMMLSTIEYLAVNWILHGKPENLLDYVDPITDQLLGGIVNSDYKE